MVQQIHDVITFLTIVSILLFILSGLVCFCYISPLIYQCIRNRKKIKPLVGTESDVGDEIKKINVNPMQIETV